MKTWINIVQIERLDIETKTWIDIVQIERLDIETKTCIHIVQIEKLDIEAKTWIDTGLRFSAAYTYAFAATAIPVNIVPP